MQESSPSVNQRIEKIALSIKVGSFDTVVDGAASLSAAVPCLSEIGNMSGNAIYDKLASR